MISNTRILTALLCLNISTLHHAAAFTSTSTDQRKSQQFPRTRPLHAFDVTSTVQTITSLESIVPIGGSSMSASAMSTINSFFQTQPYLAAFLTCSFKASAADMVAQSQEDKSEVEALEQPTELDSGVDIARNLGFLLYGGLYQGMAQNYLYNVVYPACLGTDESWTLILKEVLLDNLIFAPLLCLPIAYAFKTAFTSDDLSLDSFRNGLEKYVSDVTTKGLLTKYWTIWVPAQFLTFGVVPAHFRVAFVAAISFFWIFLLSSIASADAGGKGAQDCWRS